MARNANNTKNKRSTLYLFILLAIIAAIYFILPTLMAPADNEDGTGSNTASNSQTQTITEAADENIDTITVAPIGGLVDMVNYSYPAHVHARDQTAVSAEVNATILSIPVNEGDQLAQGATLASLDCKTYEDDLRVLEAQQQAQQAALDLAQVQFDRFSNLSARNAVSQSQVDEARANLSSNRAQLEVNQANQSKLQTTLDKCNVSMPYDGIITAVHSAKGNLVGPGTPIVDIVAPQSQEIIAELNPKMIQQLRSANDTVLFSFADQQVSATVSTVVPSINSGANTQMVKFKTNDPSDLINNANGQVSWSAGRALPSQYTHKRDNQIGIFVYDDATARFTYKALPDASEGSSAMINADLTDNTLILTNGIQHLDAYQEGASTIKVLQETQE